MTLLSAVTAPMISLQFAAEGGFSSKLIEYYGHGAYAHVDAIMPNGMLVGARQEGGVAVRAPGYAPFVRTLLVELPCSYEMMVAFYDFIHSQLGKRYDNLGIIAFALETNWDERESWFCSELVAAALIHCGYFPHLLSISPSKITPPDLLLLCSARVDIALVA